MFISEVTKVDAESPETTLDEQLLGQLQSFVVRLQEIAPVGSNDVGDGPEVGIRLDHSKQQQRGPAPSIQSIALIAFLYLLIKLCKLAG